MKKTLAIMLLTIAALSSLANDIDGVRLVIHLVDLGDSSRYCRLLEDKDVCECFIHEFVKTEDPSMNHVAHVYCGEKMMGHLYGKSYDKDFLMMVHRHAICTRDDMERVNASQQKRAQANE